MHIVVLGANSLNGADMPLNKNRHMFQLYVVLVTYCTWQYTVLALFFQFSITALLSIIIIIIIIDVKNIDSI